MKYYKVTKDNLVSRCTDANETKRRQIQYKLNEWVDSHPGTRIFVFDNLDDARKFAHGYFNSRIFECVVKGAIKHPGVESVDKIQDFWYTFNILLKKKKKVKITKFELASTPAVLVKSVKLTKEIR